LSSVLPQSGHVPPQNPHIAFAHAHPAGNGHDGTERDIIPPSSFWPERTGNPHPIKQLARVGPTLAILVDLIEITLQQNFPAGILEW